MTHGLAGWAQGFMRAPDVAQGFRNSGAKGLGGRGRGPGWRGSVIRDTPTSTGKMTEKRRSKPHTAHGDTYKWDGVANTNDINHKKNALVCLVCTVHHCFKDLKYLT